MPLWKLQEQASKGEDFAVVANEVRSLAGRSAESAKQIKDLINDSVSKVESGTQLVNQSAESLKMINESVKKIAGIVTENSQSFQEQANGTERIQSSNHTNRRIYPAKWAVSGAAHYKCQHHEPKKPACYPLWWIYLKQKVNKSVRTVESEFKGK